MIGQITWKCLHQNCTVKKIHLKTSLLDNEIYSARKQYYILEKNQVLKTRAVSFPSNSVIVQACKDNDL